MRLTRLDARFEPSKRDLYRSFSLNPRATGKCHFETIDGRTISSWSVFLDFPRQLGHFFPSAIASSGIE